MPTPQKHGQPWSIEDEAALQELVLAKLSKDDLALRLGRTPAGIANKISELSRRSKGVVSPYAVRRTEKATDPAASKAAQELAQVT